MSDLVKQSKKPNLGVQPRRFGRAATSPHERARASLDRSADLQAHAVHLEAELGHVKVNAVASVGMAAINAEAALSAAQRAVVEMEPGAIHSVAYLSQKLTLGLGAVIDDTIREVR